MRCRPIALCFSLLAVGAAAQEEPRGSTREQTLEELVAIEDPGARREVEVFEPHGQHEAAMLASNSSMYRGAIVVQLKQRRARSRQAAATSARRAGSASS